MAAPLKLSIGVNIDAAGAKSGGVQAQQAVAAIGAEAQRTQTKLQALINSSVGLNSGAANQSAREWAGALAMQGKSLDDLRAKYNPLFAVIRAYKAEITSIKTAHAQGALTSAEMTAAITRERQATLASIDAIKGRNAALRQANDNPVRPVVPAVPNTRGSGAGAFQTSNIAAQFQDIAVTSAMGMSPLQIALQQGTQLAAVMGTMERPAAGLLAAFTSILSPVALMTIAVTGLTAASIQYFTSAESGAKTVETLLQEEEEALKRVRDLWGEAAEQRSRYGRVSTGSALFGLEGSIGDLTKRLKTSVEDHSIGDAITAAMGDQKSLTGLSSRAFRETPLFQSLQVDLGALHEATVRGSDEVLQLVANLEQIGRSSTNAGIKTITQDAVAALKPFRDLAEALRDAERERRRLFDDRGESGLLLSRGTTNRDDMGNLSLYQSRVRKQIELQQQIFDAEQQRLGAKSPSERAAAARLAASLDRRDGEGVDERRQRIELAGQSALLQAEKQLTDARIERTRALEGSMDQQKLELSLIGKTVAEQERLRMEYRLTAELKAEAAKNGTAVDQAELALIRQKAAEYGRIAEQIAAINALREQDQTILNLQTELSLVGATDQQRRRVLASMQAEQNIRQRGIDTNSQLAQQLRQRAALESELTSELRKQSEAWGRVRDTGEGAIDGMIDGLLKGDFKGALKSVTEDISATFLELGVKNPLKNALLGTDYGTLGDIGGIGGVVSKLFGLGGDATAGLGKSVGAMTVSAGTVMINGGVAGGLLGGVKNLLGGNDNAPFQPNTTLGDLLSGKASQAGSALGFVGNYKPGVDPRLTDILQQAATQFPGFKVDAISGFRPGDPRFHGQRLATDVQLTDLASGRMLGNYQDPSSFRQYERFAQTARQIQMDKYPELNDQFRWGGYFGGGKGKYGALDTMHFDLAGKGMAGGNWESGLTSAQASLWPGIESQGLRAADALKTVATSSATATQGLGVLGTGFDKFGNALSSVSLGGNGGGSGGGLMGWLGGLFGGGSSQWALASSGAITGLFNTGGPTGGTNPSRVAGLVHEKEFVFDAAATARIGVENLDALRRGVLGGYQEGGYAMRSRTTYPRLAATENRSGSAPSGGVTNVFHNYSGARVEYEGEETDSRGGRQQIYTVSDMVGEGLSAKGGGAGRALQRNYGVRPRGIPR